ncbi:MAG: HAD family hydrolase [Desulfobacterales bacterium]|nr:MAG: HAD family hydrolase [Desulfobacterales bacterium]
MIKAIIFDFGQTLVDSANGFRTAEKKAQDKLFSNLGLTIREDFMNVYRRLRKAFHEQSNFSRKSLFHEIYFYYCLAPDEKSLDMWEAEYWETVKTRTSLFPEARQVLDSLNKKYKVALITNTQGQKTAGNHRISLFPELDKYFSVIIVAGEGGIPPKPDAEPFRICLEKLQIKASEAVYVGDDYRIDICGARDAGLHPIWLQHHSVRRNWPEIQTPVPVITSLEQLLDLDSIHPY